MIARFHGKRIPTTRFRELAFTDRSGTTLAGLIRAAERCGFRTRAVRATADVLPRMPLPLVAHWSESHRKHFVVVWEIRNGTYHVGDPAVGTRQVRETEFVERWTGVVLILEPTSRLKEIAGSPAAFTRIYRLLAPHRPLFTDALVAAALMTILSLTTSFFIQALVDHVLVVGRSSTLHWFGLGMLLALVSRVTFSSLRAFLLTHLSVRIDSDTVMSYYGHLLGLPLRFFERRSTGELLSRIHDAFRVRTMISATTISIAVDLVLLVSASAVTFWFSPASGLWILPILLIPLAMAVVRKPIRKAQAEALVRISEFESSFVEAVSSMTTVKSFRLESLLHVKGGSRFHQALDASVRAQHCAQGSNIAASLILGCSSIGLLWQGSREVLDGSLSLGQLLALNSLFGMLSGPVERLAGAHPAVQEALISVERLGEVLDVATEDTEQRGLGIDRPIRGSIEARALTVRHGSAPAVLVDLNFRVEFGESVLFTGPSGCGKTSLMRLLARLIDPGSGEVLVDALDIRDYSLDCVRRQIVSVPQETVLFDGSIADNIRMGRWSATPEEIHDAACRAHVDAFVRRLPKGYDTPVGERGVLLSGGQRQRIAIARAILSASPVLLLDEPTSHLDAESEDAVQALIASRDGCATTLVVSHRPLCTARTIDLRSYVPSLQP